MTGTLDDGGAAGTAAGPDYIAEMEGITVRFQENGVVANDGVHLSIRRGEVHAIVGENGSGKSTLMHVLSGYYRRDAGSIRIDGEPALIGSPREGLEHGIGMVHQHVRLIRHMTVWENAVLGREPAGGLWKVRRQEAVERLRELSEIFRLNTDPLRYAGELSAEGMQKAALLTVLYHGSDLIILDEPATAGDEPSDSDGGPAPLYSLLALLKQHGKTVVLITHKLKEALNAADTVTVMRAGKVAASAPSRRFSPRSLSTLMIGEEYRPRSGRRRGQRSVCAEEVLALEGISCAVPGYPPIHRLDVTVHRGEVTAVTGIRENGLETLEHILAGLAAPDSGTVRYLGEPLTELSSAQLRKREIAYIPTERLVRGASMESSVEENMILLNYRNFHSWGRLKRDEIEHYTGRLREEYGIKANLQQALSGLSGGNIQKVIISRELERLPKLVIFSEPSWGLDTKSRDFVFEKIELLAEKGSAVLILTSDIDEALEAGDSIVPLFRGRSVGRIDGREATRGEVGRMVLGVEHPGAGGP